MYKQTRQNEKPNVNHLVPPGTSTVHGTGGCVHERVNSFKAPSTLPAMMLYDTSAVNDAERFE